tara:strand:+ start:468 stop:761 length:294 start_codon:yes stop_codon:yes gene_type:complete
LKTLPKHFDLFGQRITVEVAENFARDQGCIGKWYPSQNRIVLQAADDVHADDVVLQTFWHEATHAALDILGYGEWSENEVFVEQFGQVIYQILKTKR